MRAFYIYLVTNLVNGKIYVGKSGDPQGRWGDHKKVAAGGKDKYPTEFFAIHAALRKYGIDKFKFEILEEFDTEDESYYFESRWIELLGSHKKELGYNCNMGGKGGISPSPETMGKLIIAANRPHIKKMKSDAMKKRHQENPRYLGRLQAKLTEQQVLEIRSKYESGTIGYLKLSKEYGVGQTTIRKIIGRKIWSHI